MASYPPGTGPILITQMRELLLTCERQATAAEQERAQLAEQLALLVAEVQALRLQNARLESALALAIGDPALAIEVGAERGRC